MTGLKGEFYWEQSRLITRKTDFAAKTEEKRDGGAGRFLWVCKSAPKLPPERPNWPKTTHTQEHTTEPAVVSRTQRWGRCPAGWGPPHLIGWDGRAPSWCRSATGDSNHASLHQDKQRTRLFIHWPSIIKPSHLTSWTNPGKSHLQAAAWFHLCHSVWTACALKIDFCPSGDHSMPWPRLHNRFLPVRIDKPGV